MNNKQMTSQEIENAVLWLINRENDRIIEKIKWIDSQIDRLNLDNFYDKKIFDAAEMSKQKILTILGKEKKILNRQLKGDYSDVIRGGVNET